MMKSLIQLRISQLTTTSTSTGISCREFDTTPMAVWDLHNVNPGSLKGAVAELTRQYLSWVLSGLPRRRESGERAMPYMIVAALRHADGSEEFLDVRVATLTRRGLRILGYFLDHLRARYLQLCLEKAAERVRVLTEVRREIY